jgi:hypothetical protein
MAKRVIQATTRLALFGAALICFALILAVVGALGPPPRLFPEFLVTTQDWDEYWRLAAQQAGKSATVIVLAVSFFVVALRMLVWVLKGLLPSVLVR